MFRRCFNGWSFNTFTRVLIPPVGFPCDEYAHTYKKKAPRIHHSYPGYASLRILCGKDEMITSHHIIVFQPPKFAVIGLRNGRTGGFWVQPISAGREYRGQFDDGQGTFEPRRTFWQSFWKAKGIKAAQKPGKKKRLLSGQISNFEVTKNWPWGWWCGKKSGVIQFFLWVICHVSHDFWRCSICCKEYA